MTLFILAIYGDMWRFNLTNNRWTWIAGSSSTNSVTVYGTKGVESSTNRPGARYYSSMFTDANGVVYMFGGLGFDTATNGKLNVPVTFSK